MNPSSSVAVRLHPRARLQLAAKVLLKQEPISQIAKQERVQSKVVGGKKGDTEGAASRCTKGLPKNK